MMMGLMLSVTVCCSRTSTRQSKVEVVEAGSVDEDRLKSRWMRRSEGHAGVLHL